VDKAQKSNVELVKTGRQSAKDLHALKDVFQQVVRLV
jgi:hypothetical protein